MWAGRLWRCSGQLLLLTHNWPATTTLMLQPRRQETGRTKGPEPKDQVRRTRINGSEPKDQNRKTRTKGPEPKGQVRTTRTERPGPGPCLPGQTRTRINAAVTHLLHHINNFPFDWTVISTKAHPRSSRKAWRICSLGSSILNNPSWCWQLKLRCFVSFSLISSV